MRSGGERLMDGNGSVRAWVRQRYYRAKHRLLNVLRDFWDRRARGYCCAAPSGVPGSPGYHFWRCNLRRGHAGAHRSVNYLWHDPLAEKLPVDLELYCIYSPRDRPGKRLDRYPALTRRQQRQRDAWHASRDCQRRANALPGGQPSPGAWSS